MSKPIVDFVEWRPSNRDVVVWHFPQNNLSTYTQLVVNESQEAVLLKEGKFLGKFGPGRHTLDTKNLPILRNFFGIPFGGKNPFTAEVWFVSKIQMRNIEFDSGTFFYPDPDYRDFEGKPVNMPISATGRYGIQIEDSEKLIKALVGTAESFTTSDLTEHFQGDISTQAKSQIASHMQADHIGIMAVSAYLAALSSHLLADLGPIWSKYGINLISFNVGTVGIDETTQAGRDVLESITQRSQMNIKGYTWQQDRAFGIADNAVSSGTEFGMVGAMMMAGGGLFGGGGGGMGAALMQPAVPNGANPQQASGSVTREKLSRNVFCSKCSKSYPNTSKFCPYCGNAYHPCPKCGADNDEHAARCTSCGEALLETSGANCPKCGHPLAPGAAFCSHCGSAAAGKTCPRCHASLKPDAAFCPSCGKKL